MTRKGGSTTTSDGIATKNLPPNERSSTTRESFEAKLAVLRKLKQRLIRNPASKVWRPRTLSEFRDWEEKGKFRAWSSKTIDSPNGPYPEFAKELGELLSFFNRDPLEELEKENEELRTQNRVQAVQIVEMESVIRSLIDELALEGGPALGERSNVVSLFRRW